MPAPSFSSADVRDYYDRNTLAFVRLGQGGGSIHRAVWGPGVRTRDQAFSYIDALIADRVRACLRPDDTPHIVDLGCGVGASLCYLARVLPIRGTGITLSPVQAQLAAGRIVAAGVADRVTCRIGDFTDLPPDLPAADAAYAVESFVHGPSGERFFAEAARLVRSGGLLIICDDVRRESTDPEAERTVLAFARGWHVNTLETRERLDALAQQAGFVRAETLDLTPFLELRRPRDRVIRLMANIANRLPLQPKWLAPLTGGDALQKALERGWLGYEFAVFRRL